MNQLLSIRAVIINFYKQYETFFKFLFKFIAGMIIFIIINKIGFHRKEFSQLFDMPLAVPFLLFSSLLFTISPPSVANLLIGLALLIQISASLELTILVFLLLVLIFVFYTRLAPKKSYLIIALIIGFYFKMPYAVVLFAGLYLGLTSIIPITIGSFIWCFIPVFKTSLETSLENQALETSLSSVPTGFFNIFKIIFEACTNNFDWMYISLIFAVMILFVFLVSKLSISYSKLIAIILGTILSISGFLVGNRILVNEISPSSVIIFSLLSGFLVLIIKFFDIVLDYNKAENVQFEDDNFYYYVKAVPKVLINTSSEEVKEDTPKKKTSSAEATTDIDKNKTVVNTINTKKETITSSKKDKNTISHTPIEDSKDKKITSNEKTKISNFLRSKKNKNKDVANTNKVLKIENDMIDKLEDPLNVNKPIPIENVSKTSSKNIANDEKEKNIHPVPKLPDNNNLPIVTKSDLEIDLEKDNESKTAMKIPPVATKSTSELESTSVK